MSGVRPYCSKSQPALTDATQPLEVAREAASFQIAAKNAVAKKVIQDKMAAETAAVREITAERNTDEKLVAARAADEKAAAARAAARKIVAARAFDTVDIVKKVEDILASIDIFSTPSRMENFLYYCHLNDVNPNDVIINKEKSSRNTHNSMHAISLFKDIFKADPTLGKIRQTVIAMDILQTYGRKRVDRITMKEEMVFWTLKQCLTVEMATECVLFQYRINIKDHQSTLEAMKLKPKWFINLKYYESPQGRKESYDHSVRAAYELVDLFNWAHLRDDDIKLEEHMKIYFDLLVGMAYRYDIKSMSRPRLISEIHEEVLRTSKISEYTSKLRKAMRSNVTRSLY